MIPTRDDFEIWQVNPVTEYVMRALRLVAQEAKDDWQSSAWAGQLDPAYHARTQGRVTAYEAILNMTFDGVQSLNGDGTEDAEDNR